MRHLILLFIMVGIANPLFAQTPMKATSSKKLKNKITQLFTKTLKKHSVHNAFLLVHSPSHHIHWNYLGGKTKNGQDITNNHYFHTASLGKTFTATIIALLQEKQLLAFDDPISKYLSQDVIKDLHVLGGKDYSKDILVQHLLQHTAGLPDYFLDKATYSHAKHSNTLAEAFIDEPQKHWTPLELIAFSKQYQKPLFAPGNGYHYTDTGYILLGLIIEKITGKTFHENLDQFIFKPLEMQHTSLAFYSKPKIASPYPLTEIYLKTTEVSRFNSLSLDWAGGGIISTQADLLKFMKALINYKLVKKNTLMQMQQWVKESQGMYYGYGLMNFRLKELFFLLPQYQLIGHSGFTGSYMYYNPTHDLYLIGTFNQSKYMKKHIMFLIKILNLFRKYNQ